MKLRRVRICSTKDFTSKILLIIRKYRYLWRIKRILDINLNFYFDFVFFIYWKLKEPERAVVVVVFSFWLLGVGVVLSLKWSVKIWCTYLCILYDRWYMNVRTFTHFIQITCMYVQDKKMCMCINPNIRSKFQIFISEC